MLVSLTLMINLIKPTAHVSTPMLSDLFHLIIWASNNKKSYVSQQLHNRLHKDEAPASKRAVLNTRHTTWL